jgi:hypothetical protein
MSAGQLRLIGREMARLLEFEVAVQALFKWLINVGPARSRVGLCVNVYNQLKGLILAQNERWRRGLGMQVER